MPGKTVADAVSKFGASVKPKLANVAISGAPEDQLRGPLETLVRELAEAAGLPVGAVHLVGETTQSDLKTRPDFAATVSKALVGFIEVKAPGKGADPRKFSDQGPGAARGAIEAANKLSMPQESVRKLGSTGQRIQQFCGREANWASTLPCSFIFLAHDRQAEIHKDDSLSRELPAARWTVRGGKGIHVREGWRLGPSCESQQRRRDL